MDQDVHTKVLEKYSKNTINYPIAKKEWKNIDQFWKKIRSRINRCIFGTHQNIAVCLRTTYQLAVIGALLTGITGFIWILVIVFRYIATYEKKGPAAVCHSMYEDPFQIACYNCTRIENGEWDTDLNECLFKND